MKLFILSFLLLTSSVFANHCAKDASKFCPDVDFGKGQVAKCLSDYRDQLSPACAKEMNLYDNKTAKINPCYKDLADFCADIPTDSGKVDLCLLKNESRLSPKCQTDFRSKKSRLIVNNECAQDIVNVCYPEIAGDDGAINQCLMKNREKLSKFCKVNVDTKLSLMRQTNPCVDDTLKLCPIAVRVIDIHECLEKKVSSLSSTCQAKVKSEMEKARANPCYKDLVRHCKPNISPDEQSYCLTLNDRELSSACKHHRVQESKKIESMVTNCEADRLKFCANAPMKNGMVVQCLRKNKASLSPLCKNLL
jgi:Golgi apparatus protein 1